VHCSFFFEPKPERIKGSGFEVAEVEFVASGGRRNGQGPDEKKSFKNLEICNF
jgi:hypothetical protein